MPSSGGGTLTPISPANAPITRVMPDDTGTLLPLDEFRRLMGFNPWHFYQLENQDVPARDSCSPVLFNHAWQSADRVGRTDILEAIKSAETKWTKEAGFAPAPSFRYDLVPFPAFYDPKQLIGGFDASGGWPGLRLTSGRIEALGVEHLEYVTDATLTFVDRDGDGIKEAFTASFATTETDPRNIAAYFMPSDRFDDVALARRWQVRPLVVSIASGIATITGRAWTVVKPILYEKYNPIALDPSTTGNFVTQLQIWTRSVYTGDQGRLYWETVPGSVCLDNSDPSGYLYTNARYTIRDAKIGYVAGGSASYNTADAAWSAAVWPANYPPTHAGVSYYGGFASAANGEMNDDMKRTIARFAVAELARPVCGCHDENREFNHWQIDLSKVSGGDDELFQVSQQDLDNCPWGTRRGQVFAYKMAQTYKRRYGISTG